MMRNLCHHYSHSCVYNMPFFLWPPKVRIFTNRRIENEVDLVSNPVSSGLSFSSLNSVCKINHLYLGDLSLSFLHLSQLKRNLNGTCNSFPINPLAKFHMFLRGIVSPPLLLQVTFFLLLYQLKQLVIAFSASVNSLFTIFPQSAVSSLLFHLPPAA